MCKQPTITEHVLFVEQVETGLEIGHAVREKLDDHLKPAHLCKDIQRTGRPADLALLCRRCPTSNVDAAP